MTTGDAFEDFLRLVVRAGAASARTLKSYRESFRFFVEWAAGQAIEPANASRRDLELYRQHLYERGYRLNTVKVRLAGVRILYQAMVRSGLRLDDPSAKLSAASERTGEVDRVLSKCLSPAESGILARHLVGLPPERARDQALCLLALVHGLRAEELTRLTVGDAATADTHGLHVRGKGAKERFLVVAPVVLVALRRLADSLAGRHDAEPLFARERRGQLANGPRRPISVRAIEELVDRHLAACGLKRPGRSIHALRHTAGVLQVLAGADVHKVRQELGHASLTTTQIYTEAAARFQAPAGVAAGRLVEDLIGQPPLGNYPLTT